MKTEAESGVRLPQAKEPQDAEKTKKDSFHSICKEHDPDDTLILDFWLPEL